METIVNLLIKMCDSFSLYVFVMVVLAVMTFLICRFALRNTDDEFVKKWSGNLQSGYGNILFIMVGILWASAVSVFGSDIKSQVFEANKEISWETFCFIITVLCSVNVGIYHYIGQQRKHREEQSRPPIKAVKLASVDIVELTQILKTCVLDWQAILNAPITTSAKEQVEKLDKLETSLRSAKRSCLKSLLNVASNWYDSDNENITYRANFFNLAPAKGVLDEFEKSDISDVIGPKPKYAFNIEAVLASPFFLFNDNWRSRLEKSDYILVNEQDLSVSLPSDAPTRASVPICMPYSNQDPDSSNGPKQPNLHGAPLSRQLKRPVYIPDLKRQVDKTIDDLKNSPAHRDYIKDKFVHELYSYYEQDSTKSILSIPVYKYYIGGPFSLEGRIDKPVKDNDIIVCIANIYTDRINMFNNDEMIESYCDIVKPITYILSVLVSMRVNLIELHEILTKVSYDINTQAGSTNKKEAA
ncbi:hypothetical protein ACK38U_08805 [Aeromonas veronii]